MRPGRQLGVRIRPPSYYKRDAFLGIETSCDDTATAVVRDGRDVLSSVATNQDEFHAKYGGIVPEIASRRHVALLSAAVEDALERAGTTLEKSTPSPSPPDRG